MGAPVHNGPFVMPMFRRFVPRKIQPWIYLCIAVTFQLSGGVYLGALNEMIGGKALMREDLLMCLYANLAGMAIYFPLLFRMKFRFTNKTLLCWAASGVMVCNFVAPYIDFLPLLWAVCFVGGMCKIQGTFECMSNIQLWMTPKRDFTVFFPWLHIVILGSMQISDLITVYLMHHYHWTFMHLFISGVMMVVLIFLITCTRHARIMRKFPLFGIDWLGGALWAALLLEIAYLFDYGDYLDWWNSPVIRQLSVVIVANLGFCIWRMLTIRHPFLEPKIWTYRGYLPLLGLITLVEAFLVTEHVLEEIFYEEVMHYEATTIVSLNWFTLIGVVIGCVFAWWWMHVRQYNYLKLTFIGMGGLILYLLGYYFTIGSDIHISQLYLPVVCRGFAYAVLSATFMVCLEEIMTFPHFFQALSVFNMLHMVVGGVLGSAVYAECLSYLVPDNISRYGAAIDRVAFSASPFDLGHYMEGFIAMMMEISIKQIYGFVLYASITLFLLFLLYDTPVRHTLKEIPRWKAVAKDMKSTIWRLRDKK